MGLFHFQRTNFWQIENSVATKLDPIDEWQLSLLRGPPANDRKLVASRQRALAECCTTAQAPKEGLTAWRADVSAGV
jgi:hypothetical protein